MPVFTISSNGALAISTPGAWEDGSATSYSAIVDQAYACTGSGSAISRQFTSNRAEVLSMEACDPLWANAGGTTPFFSGDLADAYRMGSPYSGSPANIRVATIAVLTNGQFFWAATASQVYTPPAPTIDVAPTFTVSQSSVALDAGTGTWTSGSVVNQFYACGNPITASPTPVSDFGTIPGTCTALVESDDRVPFTGGSLDDAFFGPAQRFSQIAANQPHIVVISKNTTLNQYVMSDSQEFSFPAPTFTGQLSFTITSDVIAVSDITWSNGSGNLAFYACGNPVSAQVTPTVSSLTGCNFLFFPGDRNLTTARVGGGIYDPVTQGGYIVVLSNAPASNNQSFKIWTESTLYVPGQSSQNNNSSKERVNHTTRGGLTHTNPDTLGAGAMLVGTSAIWSGISWQSTTHLWSVLPSCSGGTVDGFALTQGGPRANGLTLTVPSQVWMGAGFNTQVSSDGLILSLLTEVENATQVGSSISPFFQVGTGFCPSSSPTQQTSADVVRAAPYTGPVVSTPQITGAVAGGKVTIPGANLSGVSKVEINGLDATVTVNSDGELEITVPAGLVAGTYDLVIVSSAGRLVVQNAIVVSGSASTTSTGEARPSTKRLVDDSVKVWVFDVAGAGKVQIFVNGKEIAWVRTADPTDPKLTNGYLVRTVELAEGKNVIEVFVDGVRVDRKAYTR
jgi:hypothetical protein